MAECTGMARDFSCFHFTFYDHKKRLKMLVRSWSNTSFLRFILDRRILSLIARCYYTMCNHRKCLDLIGLFFA